ncbi:MAG: hypothetical protein ACI4RT_03575 [Candidatus Spyradenecus sp.]
MNVTAPQIVFGYHGCIRAVAERILSGEDEDLTPTQEVETYHWLGQGIYFWENAPDRAAEWALAYGEQNARKHQKDLTSEQAAPTVIGAIIRLGHCLNLLDVAWHTAFLKSATIAAQHVERLNLPNQSWKHTIDCLAINHLCSNQRPAIDTVRGCFPEGKPLFPGSFILSKTHVQLCVRNTACIIGYFRPKGVAALIENARHK